MRPFLWTFVAFALASTLVTIAGYRYRTRPFRVLPIDDLAVGALGLWAAWLLLSD